MESPETVPPPMSPAPNIDKAFTLLVDAFGVWVSSRTRDTIARHRILILSFLSSLILAAAGLVLIAIGFRDAFMIFIQNRVLASALSALCLLAMSFLFFHLAYRRLSDKKSTV